MASSAVNEAGVAHARRLIASRQYVPRSEWGDVQTSAAQQNTYLEAHSWEDYAQRGLIACHYRAAEWRHKAIELCAHELLQELDAAPGIA